MTKETHFELTCTKNHIWHEPIPTTKPKPGEHRACPICGGSSWIAIDAPRKTLPPEHTGKVVKTGGIHSASPLRIEENRMVTDEVAKTGGSIAITKDDQGFKATRIPIPADLIPKHPAPEEQKVVTEEEFTIKPEDVLVLSANDMAFWGGSNTANTI